jgi:kelch-like protein 9/13
MSGELFVVNRHEQEHKTGIWKDLWDMYQQGTLCDVKVVSGHLSVMVHANVLASLSPLFMSTLTGGMKESLDKRIDLTGMVEPGLLEVLIKYAYTWKVDVPAEDAIKLCYVAHSLQITVSVIPLFHSIHALTVCA